MLLGVSHYINERTLNVIQVRHTLQFYNKIKRVHLYTLPLARQMCPYLVAVILIGIRGPP
jgi:hypothetical protein